MGLQEDLNCFKLSSLLIALSTRRWSLRFRSLPSTMLFGKIQLCRISGRKFRSLYDGLHESRQVKALNFCFVCLISQVFFSQIRIPPMFWHCSRTRWGTSRTTRESCNQTTGHPTFTKITTCLHCHLRRQCALGSASSTSIKVVEFWLDYFDTSFQILWKMSFLLLCGQYLHAWPLWPHWNDHGRLGWRGWSSNKILSKDRHLYGICTRSRMRFIIISLLQPLRHWCRVGRPTVNLAHRAQDLATCFWTTRVKQFRFRPTITRKITASTKNATGGFMPLAPTGFRLISTTSMYDKTFNC